jgi:hypothetical protein
MRLEIGTFTSWTLMAQVLLNLLIAKNRACDHLGHLVETRSCFSLEVMDNLRIGVIGKY